MESNVAQLLGIAAEREPDRIALVEATSGRRVTWREGTNVELASRFAAVRETHPAQRRVEGTGFAHRADRRLR